jgi:CubicO group peptidase (beta-lactamase class C family)
LAVSIFLSLLGWARAEENPSAANGRKFDGAFALLKQAMAQDLIPGGVALVALHGTVVREEAFGLCDIENRIPFRTDTICWLASITKPVTTAAAMKLVEAGKLRLDDPVEKYLPEFRTQTDKQGRHCPFTVRQLMTHSAGLPERPPHRKDVFDLDWRSTVLAGTIGPIAEANLLFPPGTQVQYSNTGYYVLGRVIELGCGQRYADYVKTKILNPLGMNDSFFPPLLKAADAARMASVYRVKKGERFRYFRYERGMTMLNDTPDGGLFSSARDLWKFYQMFLDNDGRVLARQSVDEMLREQAPGRGLGWSLEQGGFAHGGSSGAFAWGDPGRGLVGILLLQINDFDRIERLQSEFAAAVRSAVK